MSYENLLCGSGLTTIPPALNVGTISILAPSGQSWSNRDFSNASGSRMITSAFGLNDMEILASYIHYNDQIQITFQPSGLISQATERFDKYSRRYR